MCKLTSIAENRLLEKMCQLLRGGSLVILNAKYQILATARFSAEPFLPMENGAAKLAPLHSAQRFRCEEGIDHPFWARFLSEEGNRVISCTTGTKTDFLTPECLVLSLDPLEVRASLSFVDAQPNW